MKFLDLTLETPAWNLAVDEGLLDESVGMGRTTGILRLWESPRHFVVVGRASRSAEEVNLAQCARDGVPVLRRCSGGTAVVAGPGCLMYAVVISHHAHPETRVVAQAHEHVMSRLRQGLATLNPHVRWQGTCDLTIDDQKISGNSLRCKRTHFLYHGTVLYDFDLATLDRWLRRPPRQPSYRAGRDHGTFVRNLQQPAAAIRKALHSVWMVDEGLESWPEMICQGLVERCYAQPSWNLRR